MATVHHMLPFMDSQGCCWSLVGSHLVFESLLRGGSDFFCVRRLLTAANVRQQGVKSRVVWRVQGKRSFTPCS